MDSKKLYHAKKKKHRGPQSLYQRYTLIFLAAGLYILLGLIHVLCQKIWGLSVEFPMFVFQVLFLLEGFAFFQTSINSTMQFSNIAIGVLFLARALVIFLQTGLTTGYTVNISNQVVLSNFIYVAILGVLIYQIQVKRGLYFSLALKNICIIFCFLSIVIILGLLICIYMLQATEAWNLEITPLLDQVLKIGAKCLKLVTEIPVAEWLLQVSIIGSILCQSNKKYIKGRYLENSETTEME